MKYRLAALALILIGCSSHYSSPAVIPSTGFLERRPASKSGSHSNGMVFRGTGDAHVLGIDAATGRLRWDVAIGDPTKGESVPMAPLAYSLP
jgi:hypothetical protein